MIGHPTRRGPGRRVLPLAATFILCLALAVLAFSRVVLRADMTDFLPEGETPATRFMLREVRTGIAARLILIGVEGAPASSLAVISRAMTARLAASPLFSLVNNGSTGFGSAQETFLLDHRYLLSPAVTPEAFTQAALRRDVSDLLENLSSDAAPLVARYGFRDPIGAFLALLADWAGGSRVQLREGVWFAADRPPDRPRVLLVAETAGAGIDIAAQQQTEAAIQAAFQAAKEGAAEPGAAESGAARLLLAGPAIFALHAALAVRGDLRLISILSTMLILGLLVWRFRSLWVIAAIAVPIALSVAAAALAVQAVFGFVHGVTLGFGITMLGITVDYPVLLIGHRRPGEAAAGTLGRIGRTLVLTVVTASLGLTGMLFSGFPGLSQLGLFSVVGLLVAALATRFVLPPLIVAADLAPASTGAPAWLLRAEQGRRWRLWAVLPIAASVAYLVAIGGPPTERSLASLSPVPPADIALDAELRREIGAPDVGQFVVVSGASAEAVLAREEALAPALTALVAQHAADSVEYAARTLPSAATQRGRQAALPSDLPERMRAAAEGLPFRPDAFDPFLADVAAERRLAPLTLADVTDPLLAARLAPLIFTRDGSWYGLIAPSGLRDPAVLGRLISARDASMFSVDVGRETGDMARAYTAQAWRWLAIGGAGVLAALVVGLRDPRRLLRVLAPIAGAVAITLAVLALSGVRLSLFHLVALQLMVGIALDYALFFARRRLDGEERARTFRTLAICNAMTLLSFGLLAFCTTPLLRGMGEMVAVGVLASILLAFLFAGPSPSELEDSLG